MTTQDRINKGDPWWKLYEELEYFGIAEDKEVLLYLERLQHSKLSPRQINNIWLLTAAIGYAVRHQQKA